MKRVLSVLAVLSAVAFTVAVKAEDKMPKGDAKMEMKAAPRAMTLKGELVDMGCYMGKEAKGEKHKSCATKCVAGGMPMGLLTDNGKLYLLTMNHENGDAFSKCKDMMAAMVEVTGVVSERAGMRSVDVTDVKPAMAASSK